MTCREKREKSLKQYVGAIWRAEDLNVLLLEDAGRMNDCMLNSSLVHFLLILATTNTRQS